MWKLLGEVSYSTIGLNQLKQIMNHGNKNPLHFAKAVDSSFLPQGHHPLMKTNISIPSIIGPFNKIIALTSQLTGIKPYVKAIIVEVATTFWDHIKARPHKKNKGKPSSLSLTQNFCPINMAYINFSNKTFVLIHQDSDNLHQFIWPFQYFIISIKNG